MMSPRSGFFSATGLVVMALFSSLVAGQSSDDSANQAALETLIDQAPLCFQPCVVKLITSVPPCAWTDPTKNSTEADENNQISCECTSKDYVKEKLSCLLDSCASNATAINEQFGTLYSGCATVGVQFASPPELLKELGIDAPASVSVPTSIQGATQTATQFPSQTATFAFPTSEWATESLIQSAEAAALTSLLGAVATGAPGATGTGGAGGAGGTNGTAPTASTAKPSGASGTGGPAPTGAGSRNSALGGILGVVGVIGVMAAL